MCLMAFAPPDSGTLYASVPTCCRIFIVPVSYPGSSSSTGELSPYPCFWPSSQFLVYILTDLIEHHQLAPSHILLRYNTVFRVSLFLMDPLRLLVHYQLYYNI